MRIVRSYDPRILRKFPLEMACAGSSCQEEYKLQV